MKTIKNIAYALLLYVAMPAATLFMVIQLLDKNTEATEASSRFIKKNTSPLLAFKLDQALLKASQFLQGQKTPSNIDDKNEDQMIPLIKAGQEASEDIVVENFSGQKISDSDSEKEDATNRIPLEFHDQTFTKQDILEDKLNRLPEEFKIQDNLKERVGFWLDIYTKYTSRFSIVHDTDRPWIIYKIVDNREVYNAPGNAVRKDANERAAISKAKAEVKKTLLSLAKKNNYDKLNDEELRFFKLLEAVPGKRKSVFKYAASNFRDQKGQKNFYKKGIVDSSKYINEMEEIFARYDLPIELVRLPLVESSFNEAAQSKVGASGIWQFMLGTGKHYLNVSTNLDERNSPIKATEAAAKLFRSNYKILKSWPLAVTAYNHGPGGLLKASKKFQTLDLNEIIIKYKSDSFSFASQNFFSEYLAALYGERYQQEVFGGLSKHPPMAADTLSLRKGQRVRELAEVAGVTLEEIKLYNPDLRKFIGKGNPLLPVGYKIRLPLGRSSRLEMYYQQNDDLRAQNKKLSKRDS